MAEGIAIEDLIAAAPTAEKKSRSKSGGIDAAALLAQQPASKTEPTKSTTPLGKFVDESKTKAQNAWQLTKKDPEGAAIGLGAAAYHGAEDLMATAVTGVAALAKSMFQPVKVDPKLSATDMAKQNFEASLDQFTKNRDQIESVIKRVNDAPVSDQEKVMTEFLGIIPDATKAVGDDVFERTGSALAAAGATALATLVTLNPDLATKTISKVTERAKGSEAASPVSAAFDELAAKDSAAAQSLADHVGQVDPMTAKYMKRRIQKFIDASDEELSIIGKNAADAAIKEMEGSMEKARAGMQDQTGLNAGEGKASKHRPSPGKPGSPDLPPDEGLSTGEGKANKRGTSGKSGPAEPMVSVEGISATIRTAAKEGMEAMSAAALDELDRIKPEEKSVESGQPKGQALYLSSGIPITKGMVESAFNFSGRLLDKVPGVEIAKGKMAGMYDAYVKMLDTEALGPEAKIVGQKVGEMFFKEESRTQAVWNDGIRRREYWVKMGEKASMEFINGLEKGKSFANPIWEKSRAAYNNWAADIFKQDMKTGFTYDPVDHYMPHLFEDSEGIQRFMQKRYGNRWADPRFIKERGYDLYSEAVEAGFTPRFRNPEEIMQARQLASDIAAMRTGMLADLESAGVARKAVKGEVRPPEGFSPNARRSPTGQRYWVSEQADALMHNAFDSKGLWDASGSARNVAVGKAFRGWMEVKNRLVPIKLGASLFHPLHVMHIDASATMTRAMKEILGKPSLESAKNFLLAPAAGYLKPLWTNPRMGSPILRAFQGKLPMEKLSDSQRAAFRDLAEGGLVPTQAREATSNAIQKYNDALARRSVSTVFHAPFALMTKLAHPLFNVWIPELKIASYLNDVKVARELNPNWTDQQRQLALRDIAKKTEMRYGEVFYKSRFMDKMLKDIGVASTLSLGWNMGLLDQYVGGSIDGIGAAKRIGLDLLDPESKGSQLKRELAAGSLDRPIFMMTYIGSAMAIGGLMQYMLTGKAPQELRDYTHPLSGEVDQFGRPQRLNTMFYTREFEALNKHIEQEGVLPGVGEFILNKGSGLMEMSRAALGGVNSLDQEIRDPEAPAFKQIEQTLRSMYLDMEPISLTAIQKATGSKVKQGVLDVMGFTPAGAYISQTAIEGAISKDYTNYVQPNRKPYESVQQSADFNELRQLYKSDSPKYDDKLDGAIAKYKLDDKDVRNLQKHFGSPKEENFDLSVWQFSKLPPPVQRSLLERMQSEEQERFLKGLTPRDRKKFQREQEERAQ